MQGSGKMLAAIFGGTGCAWILAVGLTICANLALLAGVVWVVVTVLRAMGVIA